MTAPTIMHTTTITETDVVKKGNVTTTINKHDHSSSNNNDNNKFENNEESRDVVEGENDGSTTTAYTTVWELFVTLYMPFVIDMVQYMVLGSVGFVQSSLGNVRQYIERTCGVNSVINNKNIGGGTAGGIGTSTTVDPHEWPQQFLTALGVLTVFALVVHPDGFTWVVLGKVRYVLEKEFLPGGKMHNYVPRKMHLVHGH